MTTVSGIQSVVQEVSELEQQLMRKETELTRAEETIRREQQQMRQLVCTCKGDPLGFPFHVTRGVGHIILLYERVWCIPYTAGD